MRAVLIFTSTITLGKKANQFISHNIKQFIIIHKTLMIFHIRWLNEHTQLCYIWQSLCFTGIVSPFLSSSCGWKFQRQLKTIYSWPNHSLWVRMAFICVRQLVVGVGAIACKAGDWWWWWWLSEVRANDCPFMNAILMKFLSNIYEYMNACPCVPVCISGWTFVHFSSHIVHLAYVV